MTPVCRERPLASRRGVAEVKFAPSSNTRRTRSALPQHGHSTTPEWALHTSKGAPSSSLQTVCAKPIRNSSPLPYRWYATLVRHRARSARAPVEGSIRAEVRSGSTSEQRTESRPRIPCPGSGRKSRRRAQGAWVRAPGWESRASGAERSPSCAMRRSASRSSCRRSSEVRAATRALRKCRLILLRCVIMTTT